MSQEGENLLWWKRKKQSKQKRRKQKAAEQEKAAKQQERTNIGEKLDAKVAEFKTKGYDELLQTIQTDNLDVDKINADINKQLGDEFKKDNPADLDVAREVIAKHSVKAELKAEKLQEQQQQANEIAEQQKTQKRGNKSICYR